jgi:AcrR family transcriptional regulator
MGCEGIHHLGRELPAPERKPAREAEPEQERAPKRERYQKLCPHPNGPSHEQVAAHQRERLLRAIVEAVARDGYDATTVGRLCTLAGVSKRAFYELFMGKPDCFALAHERVILRAAGRAAIARRGCEPGRDALGAVLRRLMDDAAKEPAGAGFALVHALDATPAAVERREWTAGVFEETIAECLGGEEPEPSPVVRRGIVSGIASVVRARLLGGQADELPGLAGELADWAWSCARGAAAVVQGSDPRVVARSGGTAALAPDGDARELGVRLRYGDCAGQPWRRHLRLVPSTQSVDGVDRGPMERRTRGERALLHDAAIALAARGGVLAVTPEALVADSGVSKRRVHALFESADRCLLEAVDQAGEELLESAARAGAVAEGWREGVSRGVVALLGGLAANRALARVLFVEALAVGPKAVASRASLCARAARTLAHSVPPEQRPTAVACEASVGAMWGVVERHVALGATARLPRLAAPAYLLLLAPILGGRAAPELSGRAGTLALAGRS